MVFSVFCETRSTSASRSVGGHHGAASNNAILNLEILVHTVAP